MYYCHWLEWISERECPPSHGSRVNHRYPTWSRVDGQHTVSPLCERLPSICLVFLLHSVCVACNRVRLIITATGTLPP